MGLKKSMSLDDTSKMDGIRTQIVRIEVVHSDPLKARLHNVENTKTSSTKFNSFKF